MCARAFVRACVCVCVCVCARARALPIYMSVNMIFFFNFVQICRFLLFLLVTGRNGIIKGYFFYLKDHSTQERTDHI